MDLSSKVLAGVGVRMSKYPYMDICDTDLLNVQNCITTGFQAKKEFTPKGA